jgi:energy-coupling factor transporter ATP-binding protein EcfA2
VSNLTGAVVRIEEQEEDPRQAPSVPQPQTIEETGLDFGLLLDLCIKTMYYIGRPRARVISSQLGLNFHIVQEVLTFLKREQLCEVVGSVGIGEQDYQYALSAKGAEKAEEVLARSRYVGPAPVPFQKYLGLLERQSVKRFAVTREDVERILSNLVLGERTLRSVGPAVNSGKAILLYGGSGNGKSTMAKAIGDMLDGEVLVPYAIEINGQIIKVFDARTHQEIEGSLSVERRSDENGNALPNGQERRRDRRWALVRRPVVMAGGELTLHDLELSYDPVSKLYAAPLQVKANGGVLVIDDFGRQLVQPRELLNRWIVPMDKGSDHLTLQTGESIEIPFDVLLVFSTNLPPAQLGDEAFFRRIHHKIEIPNPTREEFLQILERVCRERDITFSQEGASYLVEHHYAETGRPLRGCHPRDLTELVEDIARYRDRVPALDPDLIDLACESYFVDL